MIIGVDGNEANVKMRVGVSTYALNLLSYFKKNSGRDLQFKVFLKQSPMSDLPKENTNFKYETVSGNLFWSQIFLPFRLLRKKDIDVFFSPAHYTPRFCPVPTVVTIHDLSYLFFPQDFLKTDLYKLRNWTNYSLKAAAKIIAVSKSTKRDVVTAYKIPDDKVTVIYNGYQKEIKEKKTLGNWNLEFGNYILYVGTLQPRKNISTLIAAFAKFKQLYPEFKLVIAGKKGWLYDKIFEEVTNLALNDDVFFTDYVTDYQLIYLYKNAFCFVLPSLYEGFGIPILEAMSFGCPVISSFASSLPEIGGDACLYFDPKNIYDLVEKLKWLKENEKLRNELIKKGKNRIKEFSWEACSKKTLEIIKSAV